MQKVISQTNNSGFRLTTKLVINKIDVKSEINAANEFNKYFCEQYSRVGQGNPNYIKNFGELLNKIDITISEDPIDINELKEVFFSLKGSKSPGYDGINYNVIKNCFSELNICL